MILAVDPGSPVPPYEQIRAQVEAMTRSGVLAAGTRLPPIRQLAGDLGLAGGTVARAYRELEQQGIVSTRGRHGTVVAELSSPPDPRQSAARVTAAAESFVATAQQAGSDLDQAIGAVRAAFARRSDTSRATGELR